MIIKNALLAVLALAAVTAPAAAMAHDFRHAGWGRREVPMRMRMHERRAFGHADGWRRPFRAFHEGRRVY